MRPPFTSAITSSFAAQPLGIAAAQHQTRAELAAAAPNENAHRDISASIARTWRGPRRQWRHGQVLRDLRRAASRKQQPQIPGRQYVDVDPNHLVRVYEQHMAIQADRMVAPYLNKWLRVSGPLKNVSTTGTDLLMVTFQRKSSPSPVVMFFDKAWGDRLATKLRDSILVIDGRIEKIDNWSVRLVDCELVS